MKKIIILTLLFLFLLTPVCYAANLHDLHNVQDEIGVDKIAHFSVGYIISDQLKQHTKLNKWQRLLVVTTIAYAKEKYIDKDFDDKDLFATSLGCVAQITF